MKKTLFKYSKTKQFKDVAFKAKYNNIKSAKFLKTIKLHGTNASIVYDIKEQDIYTQSRNRVNGDSGHFGFVEYVNENREEIIKWFKTIVEGAIPAEDETHIVVYGEWIGPGIQKNVAFSQLEEKAFVVFDVRLILNSSDEESVYIGFPMEPNFSGWHSILDFEHDVVLIDFQDLEKTYLELEKQAETVTAECPVGKQFGVTGPGEGHVYVHIGDEEGLPKKFKVKGKAHQNKQQVSFNESNKEYNKAKAFAESVVSNNRLEQGIQYLEEFEYSTTDLSSLQYFIPWVIKDVLDEEDIPEDISVKFLNKEIANIARNFFNEYVNTKLFNK